MCAQIKTIKQGDTNQRKTATNVLHDTTRAYALRIKRFARFARLYYRATRQQKQFERQQQQHICSRQVSSDVMKQRQKQLSHSSTLKYEEKTIHPQL